MGGLLQNLTAKGGGGGGGIREGRLNRAFTVVKNCLAPLHCHILLKKAFRGNSPDVLGLSLFHGH